MRRNDTLRKHIFDWGDEIDEFRNGAGIVEKFIESTGDIDFQSSARHLGHVFNIPGETLETNQQVSATFALMHGLGLSRRGRSIWALDDEAYDALMDTEIPYALLRERLPRLPFTVLLIMLPDGAHIDAHPIGIPRSLRINSILLIEEEPGKMWRMMGFEDNKDWSKLAYNQGWFNTDFGPARAQLDPNNPRGQAYRDCGDGQIWRLLFNLFLTLEHGHLKRVPVVPRIPKSPGKHKSLKRTRSDKPWTRVNLSAPSRAPSTHRQGDRTSPARHRVKGHWHSYWVKDPADRPFFGSRERTKGGPVFRVAKWLPPFYRGVAEPEGPTAPPESRYDVTATQGLSLPKGP